MAKQTFTTGQVLTAAQMTSLQQTAMGGGSPSTKTASYVLVAADAGTVIQMNSASSTTITVNTALFSAGDSVQIQNIGAGVCTITAGTATVNTAGSLALSQWEGGFLYFTSASSAIFFDVVQSSSSGANFTLVNAGGTTLTGASTTVSGISGADKVFVLVSGASSVAASADYTIQFNSDTGNNYYVTNSYDQYGSSYSNTTHYQNGTGTAGNSIYLARQGSTAANTISGTLLLTGGNSSGLKVFQYQGGGDQVSTSGSHAIVAGGGYYNSSSTISSVTILSNGSGGMDAGTVYIYKSA